MHKAPHWTEHWERIAGELVTRPCWLLACDLDGALAPAMGRPVETDLRVGASAPTAARFRLNDIEDIAAFLFCLLDARLGARTPASGTACN